MTGGSERGPARGVGRRVREVRLLHNLSQAAFASRLGVSQGFVSDAERGKSKPSVEMLIGIANEFPDISLRWLLTGNEGDPQQLPFPSIDRELLKIAAYKTEKWFQETGASTAADNLFLTLSGAYREVLESFETFRHQRIPRKQILTALRIAYGLPADPEGSSGDDGCHQ